MKYLIILLFLFSNGSYPAHSAAVPKKAIAKSLQFQDIPDGRYKAIVDYFNYATYTKASYQLVVGVKYGNVTSIEFGNGGSVHSGYNNEGYSYSGGTLTAEKDYNGNIVAYTGIVTVTDSNGTRTFKVTIS